jgi:hypothetical protein
MKRVNLVSVAHDECADWILHGNSCVLRQRKPCEHFRRLVLPRQPREVREAYERMIQEH